MKHIGIFLGSEPGSGGMFQYSLCMLEALSRLPIEQYTVIAAYFDPAWQSYIESAGIQRKLRLGVKGREPYTLGRIWRAACLPAYLWRPFLWHLDPIARQLRKAGCDLWVFPSQDHWSYLAPVQALTTIHDLMHRYESHFPEVSSWGRFFIREYRFSNICRYASAVLVDSAKGREQVIDSYAVNQDHVYPLPYLPPRYIFNSSMPPGFDRRYKLPPRFLFYPAQFWAHKNHDRLLLAFKEARSICPDLYLVLAGPKRHRYELLVGLVSDLGLNNCVLFTGYIPDADLPEFYRRARALIMPTFFGPTNIPPLEAFVLGCPVAVSAVYGMPEQVGDAALLFNPGSVSEIAGCIQKIWTDDQMCRELVVKGKARISVWGQKQFYDSVRAIIQKLVCHTRSNQAVR